MTITNATRAPEFTIGDRLRKAREMAGFDKLQFAEELGIHRDTIARYEAGTAGYKKMVLMAWASATGVELDWIKGEVDGDGIRPIDAEAAKQIEDALAALDTALDAIRQIEEATGMPIAELSRLRESNSRPSHYE
jgi:transcriptional regulator with XRE-family HTH domain